MYCASTTTVYELSKVTCNGFGAIFFFMVSAIHSRWGEEEITAFLTYLAVKKDVAASTQNQALSAILFLYKKVLGIEPAWLDGVTRAKRPKRLPVVLPRDTVHMLLSQLTGTHKLVAYLIYGTGMRLMEAARLRVKDVDFSYRKITIRADKGDKDRVTMLPDKLIAPLQRHLERHGVCLSSIAQSSHRGLNFPMPWSASIPMPERNGHGSGYSRHHTAHATLAVA